MGSSYRPSAAGDSASNMYGLAWSHPNAGALGGANNLNDHGLLLINAGSFRAAISSRAVFSADVRGTLFYDYNNTGYYCDPSSASYLYSLTLAGGAYFRPSTWIQFDSTYGFYWPNNYGAHLHANDLSTYTQLALRGSKNSYGGFYDQYSAVNFGMFDSSGNGGVYREANGRWYLYHNVSNNCMGVGTSSTSSAYGIYVTKGIYSDGRTDATIFYDANNTGYYADLNGTTYCYYLQSATSVRADSDRRIKDNIEKIENALDKVTRLQGVSFTRKDLEDKKKKYIGLIAQDVLEVIPEVVSGSEESRYSVGYSELVAVLIEAVKEQNTYIKEQDARIIALENKLN
jgi:hypothetical protein